MASIYKRPKTETYQAQFYAKDPATGELVKVRKSTGLKNKKKAQALADDMERNHQAVMKAGSAEAQQARALLAEAVLEIERETFTAPTARKYLSKLLEIATGEQLETYTVATWTAEWLRRKTKKSSTATIARYKGHTKNFLTWLGEARAEKPLESITSQDVITWRELLSDEGRVGRTVNGYVKDMSGIYRTAIREGLVFSNPFTTVDSLETTDSMERQPFTSEEVSALIEAAPGGEWPGVILLAAYSGLRLGDAARISWEAVDLQEKSITLIPAKTKRKNRKVTIPLQSDLLEFFEGVTIHSDEPDAPVFPTLSKTKVGSRDGLSETFVEIMAGAGVSRGKASREADDKDTDTDKSKGNVTYERGFHSLRHTFTTWLRNAGVSEEDRMALTGHSTRESHATYSHADKAVSKAAIDKLPALKKNKS